MTRTRGGNAAVVVPVAAVLGREAAGCPPGCPGPAKGSGLYSRHRNADQASLCFHSNCESFGLLIHKRPGLCHFMQDAPCSSLATLMHFRLTTGMAALLSWALGTDYSSCRAR